MTNDNLLDFEEVFEYKKIENARKQLPEAEREFYQYFLQANIDFAVFPFERVAERYGLSVEEVRDKVIEIEKKINDIAAQL
ncbi:hypothetical protein [Evansella cellulosilytica]|uniref:Uncharacterized protein n=1 Tax=Evansella cellulosilytica (strain ATCC 21833 / DSM 2522 / FERM P-1141 / JCM 9156 / N-4) TaxID=649639 RepID=E6U1I3_EVAC2|nr:hypothetical protein [Evansella cellulosilytica]ADU30346.1 hypothetical protein Bcell_2085 [Evansella cellulosilytica DSM 2522]